MTKKMTNGEKNIKSSNVKSTLKVYKPISEKKDV